MNTCPVQIPANGRIIGDSSATSVPDGSLVQYECNEGFQLMGSNLAVCEGGRLNPDTPTCRGKNILFHFNFTYIQTLVSLRFIYRFAYKESMYVLSESYLVFRQSRSLKIAKFCAVSSRIKYTKTSFSKTRKNFAEGIGVKFCPYNYEKSFFYFNSSFIFSLVLFKCSCFALFSQQIH